MLVERITPLSNNRYQIVLEDMQSFILYKGEIQKYGLSEGADISDEVVKQIMTEVLLKRAKLRALHLLNDMDRTESGLMQKLLRGGYPQDVAEEALAYVKSFGYVDDRRYAEQYVRSRMAKKSRRELYAALIGKGLDTTIVENTLELCFSEGSECQAIEQLIRKKRFDVNASDDKEKKKMFDYLARKGFRYEDIRQVIQVSSTNT